MLLVITLFMTFYQLAVSLYSPEFYLIKDSIWSHAVVAAVKLSDHT